LYGKRRIIGLENVVEEDEYKYCTELPPIGERITYEE
jgi:hypothetical protein